MADHMVSTEDGFALTIRVPSRQQAYTVTCSLKREPPVSDAEVDLLDAVLTNLLTRDELHACATNDNSSNRRLPRKG